MLLVMLMLPVKVSQSLAGRMAWQKLMIMVLKKIKPEDGARRRKNLAHLLKIG